MWDIFHSERLELERSLDTVSVRAAIARGEINDDDLIRPAGTTTPWVRLGDHPELLAYDPEPVAPPTAAPLPPPAPTAPPVPPPPTKAPPAPPLVPPPTLLDEEILDEPPPAATPPPPLRQPEEHGFIHARSADEVDDDVDDIEFLEPESQGELPSYPIGPLEAAEHPVIPSPRPGGDPYGEFDLSLRDRDRDRSRPHGTEPESVPPGDDNSDRAASSRELLTAPDEAEVFLDDEPVEEEYDPLEEDEAVAEFTLSRSGAPRVEELDLAAMVDVAFQMVLFFMVTATTVLYKTLEVPKPNPESNPPAAAAQGRSKSLDDLKDDYILVEVDPAGVLKVDHEPVTADVAVLAERLRSERERTGRKAMLLSADFATPHRSAVLAYDAANEIGLGIAIARPPKP